MYSACCNRLAQEDREIAKYDLAQYVFLDVWFFCVECQFDFAKDYISQWIRYIVFYGWSDTFGRKRYSECVAGISHRQQRAHRLHRLLQQSKTSSPSLVLGPSHRWTNSSITRVVVMIRMIENEIRFVTLVLQGFPGFSLPGLPPGFNPFLPPTSTGALCWGWWSW